MNILYLIPIIIIISGITVFLFSFEESEVSQPITIAINIWPGYANAFVAQEKGFFKQNNVNVELVLTESYTESQKLYTDGEVDGVFEVFIDTIFHNSEGIKSQVVFISDYSDTADVLIGKEEFISNISNLKGGSIGVEGINSFSHIFVLKTLEKFGIVEGDIKFVDVPAMKVKLALDEGMIDAGHTWDPIKTEAIEKGYVVLSSAGKIPGLITDVLVFNEKIVDERHDDIQKIVKSMMMARDFVYSNEDEAIQIMAKAESMDTKSMSDGVKGVVLPSLDEQYNSMKDSNQSQSLYESGRIFIDYYLQRGQINSSVNLEDIINPDFINNLYQKST